MKPDIHPKYHADAIVTCVCGNVMKVGSTKEKMEIEICDKCHPFYTGQEKLIDIAGRVEKFKARRAQATAALKKEKRPRIKKTVKKTVKTVKKGKK